MAKLPMQKIEMIALLNDSQSIIERLQRRGIVELSNVDDERLVKLNTSTSIAQFERTLSTATTALECMESIVPQKASPFAMLNGRKPVSTKQFAENKLKYEKTISLCYSLLDCQRKISEANANITRIQTQIDILKPWLNLDIAQNFKGTKFTVTFIGTLPNSVSEQSVSDEILNLDDAAYTDITIVSTSKEQTCLTVTCHSDYEQIVFNTLRDMGFVQLQANSKLTPKDESDNLYKDILKCKHTIELCETTVKQADGRQNDIKFLIDFLQMRIDKYSAISQLGMTNSTVVISGYIPKKFVSGLVDEFERKYTIAINISEPEENDDVPVLLSNNKFSEPVEGITEMYALPNKRDVDPSSVMAFFYYLFFGMMLSDAGYGVLMVIGTTFALKKFSVEGSLRKSLRMFQYCGISTLFWGALFGSWFGDLPQVIATGFFGAKDFSTAIWFEPLDNPIKLLLFSFLLGICHLFLGLGVNFYMLWKEGKKLDAICDVIPVYITIIGVAPLAASILTTVPAMFSQIGGYVALVGVVCILLTSGRSNKNIFMRFFGGIYGLYNIATGYLSDILSYSRLLALGLATGSIAGVINLIGAMPSNPVLKAIMLIVVGVIGHTANMGINLLGAYVHSDRLQFVELFSKFYEGGGRAFNPLKVNTKYIKFEKENIYE